MLFTRDSPGFPLLGELLSHPECWRPEMLGELNSERENMDDILPGFSGLFPFADLVVGYFNSNDRLRFFCKYIEGMD